MTAETLGKIYVLIQQDYTKAALASRVEDPAKRKRCVEQLRECTEIFKRDICMFVDAELEKARYLLESEVALLGHAIYPPSSEWPNEILLDSQILTRAAKESHSAAENTTHLNALSDIPTFRLVQELMKREGVESYRVAPYEEIDVRRTGPAVVLIVVD